MDESDADLEERHWYDVMRTFLHYEDFVEQDLNRRRQHLGRLTAVHKALLPPSSLEKLREIGRLSKMNQFFYKEMVAFHSGSKLAGDGTKMPVKNDGQRIEFAQQHRNQAVLHSILREWTEEGRPERDAAFTPIMTELQRRLPVTAANAYRQRVLVPGCGLGRLPLEISALGYACEGNEFSALVRK